MFCLAAVGGPLETIKNENQGFLRYEINDVYVGSFRQTVQIINQSPFPVGGKLFIPIIKNRTALQYAMVRNISSSGKIHHSIFSDSSENVFLLWNDLRINGGETFRVELDYSVFSFDTEYFVDSSFAGEYNVSSEFYLKYTSAEEKVECNHSRIVSLARNITGNIEGWHEKTGRIYDFVRRHISYKAQDDERGALWALENGMGDCSEYSYLFVALCRAAGIPARIQAGFAFHHETETLQDGHMWTEYYLENLGWLPVDVTWRLFDKMDERHFSSIQSVPENTSYVNYLFDSKAEEEDLEDEQTVSLIAASTLVYDVASVDYISKTVRKIGEAESVIFLGRIFGTYLIFPSEAKDTEQTLLEGKTELQEAIESWCEDTKTAESKASNALEHVQESLQNGFALIAKVFMIFVIASIIIMSGAFILSKQYSTRENVKMRQ